ncbi:aminotransferase class III-fold pyridoxal phosphate-dependent enzyme [Bacillus sp. 3A_MP1]
MGTKEVTNPDSLYYKVDDVVMERGEGIYLYDSEGNEYIDCASATFNLNLGYTNKEVIDTVKEQADQLIHVTSSYQTNAVNKLAEKLVEISPTISRKFTPKSAAVLPRMKELSKWLKTIQGKQMSFLYSEAILAKRI